VTIEDEYIRILQRIKDKNRKDIEVEVRGRGN